MISPRKKPVGVEPVTTTATTRGHKERTMDSKTHAALVADLTVILQRVKYVKLGESLIPIAEEIIDTVLADRAVPEPDADAVDLMGHCLWDSYVDEEETYPAWGQLDERSKQPYLRMASAALSAVPTVQAAAGYDLDALESIERQYDIVITEVQIRPERGEYRCDIYAGVEPDDPMMMRIGYGTGPTRIAAIQNAVEKAKETNDDR